MIGSIRDCCENPLHRVHDIPCGTSHTNITWISPPSKGTSPFRVRAGLSPQRFLFTRVPLAMVRRSPEAPSPTPGGQTAPGSSIYPPEYIWNSLSDTQRDSFMSTVSASLVAADGQRKRPRTDLTTEEDANDGRVPSLVLPVLPRFPGLDRAAIIAVFEHIFRPKKDLIKLRSPEFKASALDGDSFDLKSTSSGLQFRKVVSIKDWGYDASLWAHCFSNYVAIWCDFFAAKHPLCISGMVLFHRRVCDLARAYKWQDCILQMALDHHQMVIDKGDLTVSLSDWEIGKALESSYLRPDNVLPAKTAPTTSTTRSTRSSAAPNNDTVVCEKFNSSAGCHWRTCHRRHVCSKCGNDHSVISCKLKASS